MRLQDGSTMNWASCSWLPLAIAIGICLTASSAPAEIGLMFRFRDGSTLGAGIVIAPDPRLRFEPEVGFSFSRTSFEDALRFGSTSESHSTEFEIGVGVLYDLQHQGPYRVSLGPRVGYSRADTFFEAALDGFKSETSANGWFAAAALGAEVDVTSHGTMGLEAAVAYESTSGTSLSRSGTSSRFSVILRLYPWGER